MPQIRVNNVELFYEEIGSGTETMLFSHGFLMDHTMFQFQMDSFKDDFRCIAYDQRGHGRSEAITSSYDLDAIVNDAIALIETLEIGPVHFVGMSTGGFVGLRLALQRPELLRSLVLIDTSADVEEKEKLSQYKLMLKSVSMVGWRPVIGRVMSTLFNENFLEDSQRRDEVKRWRGIITGHNIKAITPFANAIFSRSSVVDQLSRITTPSVVIAGKHDRATPMAYSQKMADLIHDARLRLISDAGHSAVVEKPRALTEAMRGFYQRVGIL